MANIMRVYDPLPSPKPPLRPFKWARNHMCVASHRKTYVVILFERK